MSADIETLKSLDRRVEAAFQQADKAFLEATLADDFRFSHGSGTVENKAETLANFVKPGDFLSRNLTSVEVEAHGNLALTSGRIEIRSAAPREYSVCYVRLYERRAGRWQLVSHRTFRQRDDLGVTCGPREGAS